MRGCILADSDPPRKPELHTEQQQRQHQRQHASPHRVAAVHGFLGQQFVQARIALKSPGSAAQRQMQVTTQGGNDSTSLIFDFRYHRVLGVGLGLVAEKHSTDARYQQQTRGDNTPSHVSSVMG